MYASYSAERSAAAMSEAAQLQGRSYVGHDFLKAHGNGCRGLYIGEPFVDIASGRRLFILSRRLEAADGSFPGVSAAPINADLLAGLPLVVMACMSSNAWNDMLKRDLFADGLVLAAMALVMLIGGRRRVAVIHNAKKRPDLDPALLHAGVPKGIRTPVLTVKG